MGQGPQRFRHISTADSSVGALHPDRLHRKKQTAFGHGRAMPLARGDVDGLTRSGREWTRFELDDELALEHQKELVARLSMPSSVQRSAARVQDRDAVHRAKL